MHERPQIIKRQSPRMPEPIASPPPAPGPEPSDSIEQLIEVPPEPERLEVLDVIPAPADLTMTDWQQEFEFNHQESVLDTWDGEVDENGNDLW